MNLSDTVIRSMAMAKVFKDNVRRPASCGPARPRHAWWQKLSHAPQTETINSLDFFENGKFLVTASEDNSVRLYDAVTGQKKTMLNSLKCGPATCARVLAS